MINHEGWEWVDEPTELEEFTARQDDIYWSRVAFGPWRGWQAFTNWWVARRWVEPRDIRKQ